jgi:hypothetical protein
VCEFGNNIRRQRRRRKTRCVPHGLAEAGWHAGHRQSQIPVRKVYVTLEERGANKTGKATRQTLCAGNIQVDGVRSYDFGSLGYLELQPNAKDRA